MKFSTTAQFAAFTSVLGLTAGLFLSTRQAPSASLPRAIGRPVAPASTVPIVAQTQSTTRLIQNGADSDDLIVVGGGSVDLPQSKPALALAPKRAGAKATKPAARKPVRGASGAAPAKPVQAGDITVCVDPGHPSETSDGAKSNGLSENRLNWQVALVLKPTLESMGIRCVLTKARENQRVTNKDRAAVANSAGAELFIRLHCDEGAGRGFRWYYPDRSARKGGVTGPPENVQRASRRAAFILNDSMKRSAYLRGYLQSNPIGTDANTFVGGKQGGVLTGSIFARVPTALIEMCFINRTKDAQFISSQAGRQRMAYALAEAISTYVRQTPAGTWKTR